MSTETNSIQFSTVFTTLFVKAVFVCVVLVRVICYFTWNCSRLAGFRGNLGFEFQLPKTQVPAQCVPKRQGSAESFVSCKF